MNNSNYIKPLLFFLIGTVAMAVLLLMASSCGSVRKMKKSSSRTADSISLKDSSFTHVKSLDSMVGTRKNNFSGKTVTIDFDTAQRNGATEKDAEITYNSDSGMLRIVLGNNKPKRITIKDYIKNSRFDSVSLHKVDSLHYDRSDSTAIKESQKESESNVHKKNGMPFWIWFLIVLVLLSALYRYRWRILELFKK